MSNVMLSLIRAFAETYPDGAAHALEALRPEDAANVLIELPLEVVGPVAERLTPHAAAAVLGHVPVSHLQKLLGAMSPRDAALLVSHIDERYRETVLSGLPDGFSRRLRTLISYPPETAGGIMDPQVVSLAVDLKTHEAVSLLRRAPRHSLYYLYVTDRNGALRGVVSLRDLLLASPDQPIQSFVNDSVVSVPVGTDREDVATLMRQRGFVALPVVDDEGRLLGVVKHDEVLDTVQEEAFEDLQKMVGAGGDEEALSPVATVIRRRLPWLVINLFTAFSASAVVSLFEDTIAKVTALAIFLPIVSGQGGNSGAQALAVVMRGLALKEIQTRAARRVILKELTAGIINGLVVGLITGLVVGTWGRSPALGIVIGLAMIVNMAIAAVAGSTIPLLLQKLGRDPAQSSTIFLTTVTDIVGFAAFLGFASIFLSYLT